MTEKLETIDIKGKEYITVNERLKYFRKNFKNYKLTTKIIKLDNGIVVLKAEIRNTEGDVVADGLAYEKEGSSFINKTSYVENCQTSAWGRALGNFGIGIDSSVSSADEVANAILQQNEKPTTQRDKLKPVVNELNKESYAQIEARKNAISQYSILLEVKNPKNKDDLLKAFKTKNMSEMRELYKQLQAS
jgi:hypothetical protein